MPSLDLADLDRIYEPPIGRTLAKTLDHVDRHAARFIALSPFCVLATTGADGTVDVSPRGGAPGFVRIETPRSLLMPDRPGNNRLDSFRNLLSGAAELSLIFFIPGVDETLRIAGRGSVDVEPELLASMTEFGKPPKAVLRIAVREAFLHCAKALMRARLWSDEARVERKVLPSLGEMIRDQTGLGAAEPQADMVARYRTQL
jgi:PPOX class probable FMN-dependent enzyme